MRPFICKGSTSKRAIRNCGFDTGFAWEFVISAPFSLRPPDVFLGAELVPSAAWPVSIRVSLVSRQKLTKRVAYLLWPAIAADYAIHGDVQRSHRNCCGSWFGLCLPLRKPQEGIPDLQGKARHGCYGLVLRRIGHPAASRQSRFHNSTWQLSTGALLVSDSKTTKGLLPHRAYLRSSLPISAPGSRSRAGIALSPGSPDHQRLVHVALAREMGHQAVSGLRTGKLFLRRQLTGLRCRHN